MPLYSALISAINLLPLAKFGWVPFVVCNAWQQYRTENSRKVGEICSPILTRLYAEVHRIFRRWEPSYFPTLVHDCLCHVSFRRYSPLSREVVKKPNSLWSFWPSIFGEGRPRLFNGILLARFTVHRLAKFGWVPFADLRLRSLAIN